MASPPQPGTSALFEKMACTELGSDKVGVLRKRRSTVNKTYIAVEPAKRSGSATIGSNGRGLRMRTPDGPM